MYLGEMRQGTPAIPILLVVEDLDFVELPLIAIKPGWTNASRLLPHILGPGRAICYYAKGSVILDRYNPAGTVVQCLERAEKVVRDALRGQLDDDFATEFRSYWLGTWMLVDLPKDFVGQAKVYFVKLSSADRAIPVLAVETSWALTRSGSSWDRKDVEAMAVVSTEVALTPNPDAKWPPSSYAEFTSWLSWLDPKLPEKMDRAIELGDGPYCSLAVRAPNGVFAVRVDVPRQLRTPEFLRNRRKNLPKQMSRLASTIEIERVSAAAADLDYIYTRNMAGGHRGLLGKRVLQIGCGTIGGFLAQQLAQSGAGIGGGKLTVVDTDQLRPENLGRHLLGVPFLHRNKAEGCAEFLNATLPGAQVEAIAVDGLGLRLDRYDLVVDATGEEAVSIALNDREIRSRPDGPAHIYVWLLGNGAAGQAILTGEPGKACFKCLKPELAGQARFHGLRPEVNVEVGAVAECGDADFLPFPVSRSVSAAAIACDMALDWANGALGHRFRSATFDERQAYQTGNSSPAAMQRCPACGNAH